MGRAGGDFRSLMSQIAKLSGWLARMNSKLAGLTYS